MSPKPSATTLVRTALRGVGQIVFQDSAATGVLFLTGVCLRSPLLAAGGLLGVLTGTLAARAAHFDPRDTDAGIYGFNAALVGLATVFYFRPTLVAAGLLLFGAMLATFLCRWLRRFDWPTYTTPFIATTWALVEAGRAMGVPPADTGASATVVVSTHHVLALLQESFSGLAEIMFGAGIATGVVFLIAIAVNTWRHAVLALLGSLTGTLIAHYHNDPQSTVSIGIYGYNAALAAMAVFLWRPALAGALLAAVISVPLTEFFPAGLPALTAPFVGAAWLVIAMGRFAEPRLAPPRSTG